jgi:hypothetical protein
MALLIESSRLDRFFARCRERRARAMCKEGHFHLSTCGNFNPQETDGSACIPLYLGTSSPGRVDGHWGSRLHIIRARVRNEIRR